MEMHDLLFLAIAAVTILSAVIVAFSNKIIHSAFALLATFGGFAALYIYLSADFLAVTQIVIYVGGILILILFGVLMTQKIYDPSKRTTHNSFWVSLLGGILVAGVLGTIIYKSPWLAQITKPFSPTTSTIGTDILTTYLLPFEIISVLLLGALIGAIYIARTEEDK